MTFYGRLMAAYEKEQAGQSDDVLKNVSMLSANHTDLVHPPSPREKGYGMGWLRTELPGSLGAVGVNPLYMKEMPTCGRGFEKPRLCLYHNGSLQSSLSSVHMLPDTQTAIVVLSNGMALDDTADWIGQCLLEAVLDNPVKNDYLALAKQAAQGCHDLWANLYDEIKAEQQTNTTMRPISAFLGTYWNKLWNWRIEIFEDRGALQFSFQGHRQTYDLGHYHNDTLTWVLRWDEAVQKGRQMQVTLKDFYLFHFRASDGGGQFDERAWLHDLDIGKPETFYRSPPGSSTE